MIRLWLRALVRNFLPGPGLQKTSRLPRRPRASLRLEALEKRTVTSTLIIEPPGLLEGLPQASGALLCHDALETVSGDLGLAIPDAGKETEGDQPVPDGQPDSHDEIDAPAPEIPAGCETFGSDDPFSSSASLPGPGPTPQPPPPAIAPAFNAARAESLAAQRALAAGVARADKDIVHPGADPRRVPQARPGRSPRSPRATPCHAEPDCRFSARWRRRRLPPGR